MSILLINPSLENSKVAVGVGFPIGLAQIASSLEEASYRVRVLDLPAESRTLDGIIKEIRRLKPKIIGLTALTPTFLTAVQIAKKVSREFPKILIVFGGVHVTFLDREAMSGVSCIDVIVRGEGEETMKEVAKRYLRRNSADFQGIKGVTYRYKGRVYRNPDRQAAVDLGSLPAPAYHLFPMSSYAERQYGEFGETFSPVRVLASRGCPYNCNFCLVPVISGRKYRQRPAEDVLDELQLLRRKYGIKNFKFADDNFTLDSKYVTALCQGMRKRKLKMNWECEARVDLVSDKMLRSMRDAGCTAVWYGIESSSAATIKRIRKGISLPVARKAIKAAQRQGIRAGAFFVMGLPYDGIRRSRDFVKWAIREGLDAVVFSVLTPFPGTEIFREPKRFGIRISSKDWNRYTESDAVIETKLLTSDDIRQETRRAYLDFYCRSEYLLKKDRKWRFHLARHVLGFVGASIS